MKRTLVACAAALCLAPGVGAQGSHATHTPNGWTHGAVHYGRWATAVAAIGVTVLAAREHSDANRNWQGLLALCRNDNAACQLRPDGQYVDYTAELLYQKTLYFDHRARSRLIAGQALLLASATLFILDLRHHGDGPPNIPFHGLQVTAEPAGSGARFGVRLPL